MPKLPVLSGAEVIKALEQLGFAQIRQRGSHVVMRRGGAGTVVPLHREVKTGTLVSHRPERGAKWVLKQVQDDEEGKGMEVFHCRIEGPALLQIRHPELVSGPIAPQTLSPDLKALVPVALKRAAG